MKLLRDLFWILPSSLVLGLVLSLSGPGVWWIGWLAYFALLTLGLLAISALWRSAGAPRLLLLILLLAAALRLGLGIAFSCVLPVYGTDSPVLQAGFAVRDASSYDAQAWQLASSGDPLWHAFDHSYKITNQYDDQYGGLLFFHSLAYRYLSPDAHRPWLLILLSALAGAIGTALAWKGARQAWGDSVAWGVGWIMALYPESLLAGASAVRESFLLLFIAMIFWGALDWLSRRHRPAWAWLAGGTFALILYSPGVAGAALAVVGIWAWLREKERRVGWGWFAGLAVAVIVAVLLLGVVVGGTLQVPSGPLSNLFDWLRYSANYGAYVTEHNSGWIQTIFETLPEPLHLPFIVAYGVAQPVLPAAVVDPAVWPMRILGILRGLGWYALLPFLIYCLRPIFKTSEKRERLAWLWLWLVVWVWIILASARAGGDQWDNPRYRMILLLFQASLAAYSLLWARRVRDPWWGRALAVEGVFLMLFGYWYAARYLHWQAGIVHVYVILELIFLLSVLILGGGWLWDWRHRRPKK